MFGLEQWNHNVVLTYVYWVSYSLATGLWEDGAYPNWVSIVEHGNNRMVGWLEGLEGLCSLFFAIPFGTLADRWRRDRVLRISSCIELAAVACTVAAVSVRQTKPVLELLGLPLDVKYLLLCLAALLWGTSRAGGNVVDSSLADSVPTGEPPSNAKFIDDSIHRASWTMHLLLILIVIYSGIGLSIVPAITLMFFDDDKFLREEEEEEEAADSTPAKAEVPIGIAGDLEASPGASTVARSKEGWIKVRHVPYIFAAHDCIGGIASGMTVKFLPIWYRQGMLLSPAATGLLQAAMPASMAVLALCVQPVSTRIGRVQTMLGARGIGVLCQSIMAFAPQLWPVSWIMVPVLLFRIGFMASTGPLKRSIVMDMVPRSERGFWNGLADVWTFNWCGSAVVGGYLLDWYGFRVSFALTALFQLIGWALLLLLLPVVPRHEGSEATAAVAPPEHTSAAAAEAVVAATEPELAQPLLAAQN